MDIKFNVTKRVGKGIRNGRVSYSVSEDINLTELKKYAKSKDLSLNELFNTAAIVAYSKMDLPEYRTPTQFNVHQSISMQRGQKEFDDVHF